MADVTRIAYGVHDDNFGEFTAPAGRGAAPAPVVVLVHGGFWRHRYECDLMHPLIPSLTGRGVVVWNIEYRRVDGGGGYPETLVDVAAAVDHLAALADEHHLDLSRVAIVGHSAGGHLATWSACRSALPEGVFGANPIVQPVVAISQAGVLDLLDAVDQHLGDGATLAFMGASPDELPVRYRLASPIEHAAAPRRVLLIHGAQDDTVPLRQSERYLAAARAAGADVDLVVDDTAGHFEHLDPNHAVWHAVLDEVAALGP